MYPAMAESNRLLFPGKTSAVKFRPAVEAWIADKIRKDGAKGRSMNDFPPRGLVAKLESDRESLEARGIETRYGAGNIFYVVYKYEYPIVIQVRPLAQRVVRLVCS